MNRNARTYILTARTAGEKNRAARRLSIFIKYETRARRDRTYISLKLYASDVYTPRCRKFSELSKKTRDEDLRGEEKICEYGQPARVVNYSRGGSRTAYEARRSRRIIIKKVFTTPRRNFEDIRCSRKKGYRRAPFDRRNEKPVYKWIYILFARFCSGRCAVSISAMRAGFFLRIFTARVMGFVMRADYSAVCFA